MQLWKSTGYQYQVTLVVMITQLREGEPPNQRTKAEQYWPDRCVFLSICLIRWLFCQLVLQVVKLSSFLFVCLFFMFLFFVHLQKKKKDKTVHMIILSPTQSDEPFTKCIKWLFFSLSNFLEWQVQFSLCSQDDSEMAQTVTFLGGLKVKTSRRKILSMYCIWRIKLMCVSNVFRLTYFSAEPRRDEKSFSIKVDHVSTSTNASYVLRLHLFKYYWNSTVLDIIFYSVFKNGLQKCKTVYNFLFQKIPSAPAWWKQ